MKIYLTPSACPSQVSAVISSALHTAITDAPGDVRSLLAISVLLQHGAKPSSEDIIFLVRIVDTEKLDDCFFRAMESAGNSFVPGLNLALAIDSAVDEAQPMERNKLRYLRNKIDKVLIEVLRYATASC